MKLKTIVLLTLAILAECKGNKCGSGQFGCTNGTQCFSISSFCDGFKECKDGFDEPYRNLSRTYQNDTKFCRSKENYICELPSELVSSADLICKESIECDDNQFPCTHGGACIPSPWFCDGLNDCGDGSDDSTDLSGLGRICDPPDQKKSPKKCLLPEKFVCETARNETNRVACKDGIDECLCSDGNKELMPGLTCAHNTTMPRVSIESVCNGSEECSNGLDERNCSRAAGDGTSTSGTSQNNVVTPAKNYKCAFEDKNVTRCDGHPECIYDLEGEECRCANNSKFCSYLDSGYFRCTTKFINTAFGNGYLIGREVCNGQMNCENMEDEESCTNRFYCGNATLPNYPLTKMCDMVDDCEDGSDEANCSHFYCKDGGSVKYIDRKKVCDTNQDCAEGSDECVPSCIKSDFSNEKSLIKNNGVRAVVAIFGIVALVGNLTVTFLMIRLLVKLFKRGNRESKGTKLTAMLIMNLSIADLFVGIYILAIFAKSVEVEGKYCLVDREWRSSLPCSFVGVLLVAGSEESVLTMVLITIMRMRVVLWPRANVMLKRMFALILATWTLSLAIALVPLVPSFEDYFVDSIWYRSNSLFTTIEKKEIENLTNWLSFYFNKANKSEAVGSWGELEELIRNIDPNLTVAQKYGFYSTHTVCLPTFLPNRDKDTAWAYSLGMILLNFVAFFVIAIGYAIMFNEATKPNTAIETYSKMKEKRDEQNKQLQGKLFRIVASDFFCWMPVIIMALCQFAGVKIPSDAYLPIGLIIIPINSALNPFLYSKLPDMIWEKLSPQCMWMYATCCLPIKDRLAGVRRKSDCGVATDDIAGVYRHQVMEMKGNETGIESLGENSNGKSDVDGTERNHQHKL